MSDLFVNCVADPQKSKEKNSKTANNDLAFQHRARIKENPITERKVLVLLTRPGYSLLLESFGRKLKHYISQSRAERQYVCPAFLLAANFLFPTFLHYHE